MHLGLDYSTQSLSTSRKTFFITKLVMDSFAERNLTSFFSDPLMCIEALDLLFSRMQENGVIKSDFPRFP